MIYQERVNPLVCVAIGAISAAVGSMILKEC